MNNSGAVISREYIDRLAEEYRANNKIDGSVYEEYDVKRGLRNRDGTGVIAGVTRVANVEGYVLAGGEKIPTDGKLTYRGIDVTDIVESCQSEKRYGFEETAYLLLLGKLPTRAEYDEFRGVISESMFLPPTFLEDIILKWPSKDIMNKLARSVLSLYSYDENPDDTSLPNLLRQSIELIARFPYMAAKAHAVKRHYFNNESLYLHRQEPDYSIAQNFLRCIRPDKTFMDEEARLLDICLILHAEHGGGNNSTFTCRSVASSGADAYSAVGAACGALKGPRHGGANQKVMRMFREIGENVKDWTDETEIYDYLCKILRREAGDGSGLIYGMGHAIYTNFDPRARILREQAHALAEKKGMAGQLRLMESIEKIAPSAFLDVKGNAKKICANVDMYSGLIYHMLDIPLALHTPIFAVARIVGWCAHLIEEATAGGRIIRPAYKAVTPEKNYISIEKRKA